MTTTPLSTDAMIVAKMCEIESAAVLSADPIVGAAQKRQLDHILAIMEVYRQRPGTNPEADYTMRLAEAIVAKAAAYEDRAEWSWIENAVREDLGL